MSVLRTLMGLLSSPGRALPAAAERRSVLPPLVAATAASLLFTSLLVPRVDWERVAQERLEQLPEAEVAQMTPHDREEAVTQQRRMGWVLGYAGAALGPAAGALAAALFLWLAFRVAGAKPAFLPTLAVAAWGLLPVSLGQLLAIPAVLRASELVPRVVPQLLPWNASWFLPLGAGGPALAAASSVSLFSLWSLFLLAVGMAAIAGTSRLRSLATVAALWSGYVALGMAAAASGAA